MPPEIDELFSDCTPARYAVLKYCASCVAHRLLKLGWEPQVNLLTARRLVLLCMYLPIPSRVPILEEAFFKAVEENDQKTLSLLKQQFEVHRKEAV